MKGDINIPEVKDVHIAIVYDTVDDTVSKEWNAYIINNKSESLETVIIVSDGYSETQKTSTIRKTIHSLPKKSFAKIEMIPDNLLKLENVFKLSFFLDNKLYDKTYTFKIGSIDKAKISSLPLISQKGIIAQ